MSGLSLTSLLPPGSQGVDAARELVAAPRTQSSASHLLTDPGCWRLRRHHLVAFKVKVPLGSDLQPADGTRHMAVKTWRAAPGQARTEFTSALPGSHGQDRLRPRLPAGEAGTQEDGDLDRVLTWQCLPQTSSLPILWSLYFHTFFVSCSLVYF